MRPDNSHPPTHAAMRCPSGRETASPDAATNPATCRRPRPARRRATCPVPGRCGLCGVAMGRLCVPRASCVVVWTHRESLVADRMEDVAVKKYCCGLSPGKLPTRADDRFRQIADWWSQLRIGDDSGATTWEVLDALERQVTECLTRDPPDVAKAESVTAKAALLIAGCCDH